MKKVMTLIWILWLCTLITSADAAEFTKVGTSVAQFLKIPAGARAASLGGAYAAAAEDVFAMAWNPAGLGHIKRTSLAGTYKSYIADLDYSFVGVAVPMQGSATFGVSALFLTTNSIEITTIEQPNGTGTYYDYSGFVLGVSYSRWLTDLLTVGATVKLIRESIYRESASALAFDIGSQFDTGLYGVRLAMCIANFGSKMQMDGPDINSVSDTNPNLQGDRDTNSRLRTQDWPLPLIFRMGIMMDLVGGTNTLFKNDHNRLTLMMDANDPIDHNLRGNFGLEYSWNKVLSLRGGYYSNYDENTIGLTFGAGVNLRYGSNDVKIDYAYQDFGLLDSVHQYTLSLSF